MRARVLQLTQPGWIIVCATAVLIVMGIASIYVTDTHYVSGHDGPANAAKQAIRIVISAVIGLVILKVGHQHISRYAYAIFFITLALLLPLLFAKLLHTSFGGLTAPRNGAYRWLHLPGFPLQPSELMKIAYVLALAWYLRYRKNYRRFWGLVVPVVLSSIPIGLILLEPDLGTALLLVPVLFAMLFQAGAKIRHLLILCLLGLAVCPVAWRQIQGYQRARVTAVLLQSDSLRKAVVNNPERYARLASPRQAVEWAASSGYQLVHSKTAVGSGGVFGNGWGKGVYVETSLLPDRHNDFIFSVVAHQWGFIGSLIVLSCFVVIVLAGVRIVSATVEPFGRLLAVGIVALISTQVVINIGMTVGLMPITGMTLPFVSYGGSSLLSNFAAVALLISVARSRPFVLATRSFEFGTDSRDKPHLFEQDGVAAGDDRGVSNHYEH